jgi:hypothetical protein
MRGFSMFKKIPHWDDLMFMPGTDPACDRATARSARRRPCSALRFAKKPIELGPAYITA